MKGHERKMNEMKTNEIIRELMGKNGVRFNALAEKLGLQPNALASRLNRRNFSTNVLNQMLGVFGYKIMLVPKDVALRSGWYEVENSRDEEDTEEK